MSRPLPWSHRLASRGQTLLSLAALVGAGWVFWASAELPPPGALPAVTSAPSGPAAAASAVAGASIGR